MKAIKLFKVDEINGVTRLQSQLSLGKDSADFIIENGKLYNWKFKGLNGTTFYETDIPFTIVDNINEMTKQKL